jgi:hypothetical protein
MKRVNYKVFGIMDRANFLPAPIRPSIEQLNQSRLCGP